MNSMEIRCALVYEYENKVLWYSVIINYIV